VVCQFALDYLRERECVKEPEVYAQALMFESERAKIDLSTRESTNIIIRDVLTGRGEMRDVVIELNRDKFRELTDALNNRVRHVLENTLRNLRINEGPNIV
jgi:molecular chaperone DnaK (HSP70)